MLLLFVCLLVCFGAILQDAVLTDISKLGDPLSMEHPNRLVSDLLGEGATRADVRTPGGWGLGYKPHPLAQESCQSVTAIWRGIFCTTCDTGACGVRELSVCS